MPLDKATTLWQENEVLGSKPMTVATITIPAADVSALGSQCENMEFTAWHALREHRPAGSVNEARGIIYKRLSDYRRTRNQIPLCEPDKVSYNCRVK